MFSNCVCITLSSLSKLALLFEIRIDVVACTKCICALARWENDIFLFWGSRSDSGQFMPVYEAELRQRRETRYGYFSGWCWEMKMFLRGIVTISYQPTLWGLLKLDLRRGGRDGSSFNMNSIQRGGGTKSVIHVWSQVTRRLLSYIYFHDPNGEELWEILRTCVLMMNPSNEGKCENIGYFISR